MPASTRPCAGAPTALLFLVCFFALVILPSVLRAQSAPVPSVDPADRAAVVDLYRNYYRPSNDALPGWTGSVDTGAPGTLNADFVRATLRRINYFRAMSALPGNVVFDAALSAKCQQAALMMAAERNVSHSPGFLWKFYTSDAAEAARHSDLNLDWHVNAGPGAIDRYMDDPGPRNASVGHRRWLLYAGTTTMALGAVPANGTLHPGTNVTWVANGARAVNPVAHSGPPAPVRATAWPPAGYVPAPLVYDRWSFSRADADFHRATVRVTKDGAPLIVAAERPKYQSAPDGTGPFLGANTLVWTLPGNRVSLTGDETYEVTVGNVLIDGQARQFCYTVTSIDVNRAGGNLLLVSNAAARKGTVVR